VATTIFNALLPIVLTLMMGVLAAWHNDFDQKAAAVLNRMVMVYALPLMLFAGIAATPRDQLLSDATIIVIIGSSLLAGYVVPLLIAHYIVGRDLMTSTLQALAIGGPSVAFVGLPVLGYLFGTTEATVPIVISSLVLTMVQIPASFILLSRGAALRGDKSGAPQTILDNILSTIKQPMVWAPVLAVVMLLVGISIPQAVRQSMNMLGHATSGVALFASGVILYSQRVSLSIPTIISTLSRNVVMPALVWAIVAALGINPQIGHEAVLTVAIPTAVICVILAVQFRVAEQEMASTLFLSNCLSLPTMGAFIWLLGG
jgi:malonate transporter